MILYNNNYFTILQLYYFITYLSIEFKKSIKSKQSDYEYNRQTFTITGNTLQYSKTVVFITIHVIIK